MPFLVPLFLDGRDRVDSQIQLTADWLSGWKFKDGKWKFEEEVKLPHVDSAYFRCRVHLFGGSTSDYGKEAVWQRVADVHCDYDLDGVQFASLRETMLVVAPLDLEWSRTKNESKNPCLFRETGQCGLALKPVGDLSFQLLITYRNLDQLLRSERMFAEEQNGFRWIGSPRRRTSGASPP